jgi:hypothetical protein
MNNSQRLQLQNMIKANNVEDQTQLIRNLKHSQILKDEVNTMMLIKAKHRGNDEKINIECVSECNFLFNYYTDIYNRLRKDELNVDLLFKLLDVLKSIEDEELDQHEGSFKVGTILKEIYVDSSLKKAEKLNQNAEKTPEPKKADVEISWKQFKQINTSKK